MNREPARYAPLTWISANGRDSSTAIGSGSVACPSARARKARSIALIAAVIEMRSRNSSSGTARILLISEGAPQSHRGGREGLTQLGRLVAESEPEVAGHAEVLARHEQDALSGAHPLDEIFTPHLRAVAREADRAGLRRHPGERVAEGAEPGLEHRVIALEDVAGALQQARADRG